MNTSRATTECIHCKKGIDRDAIKCPYCHSSGPTITNIQFSAVAGFLVFLGLGVLVGMFTDTDTAFQIAFPIGMLVGVGMYFASRNL